MKPCKYNLPRSRQAKLGLSRSVLYANGIVDFKSDLKSMVAAFGAEHVVKVARLFEKQFEAALKKQAKAKTAKPRVRVAAETRTI